MPNHVLNKVVFLGKEEAVEKAKKVLGEDFDLNAVTKEPEDLTVELLLLSVSEAERYFEKEGKA